MSHEYDGDERVFMSEERNSVCFVNNLNRVIQSKCFQINYMTYNVCRDQDMLRPGHGAAVMMLSQEHGPNAHPFWYAQVLSAFLIKVSYKDVAQTIEVLWIRWFGVVPGYQWGIKKAQLPQIGFVPDSPGTFGFLDPSLVIHAYHLIPTFAEGCTSLLLPQGTSVAQENGAVDDWAAYYVNM